MFHKESNEYDLVIDNLERLRLSLNIEMQEIDKFADLGTNTYSRIISKKQPIRLDELISIGNKIYNLNGVQFFNSNLKTPLLKNLPDIIRDIIKERKGKSPRQQEKRDIIKYCILILSLKFKVGDEFTNSAIKGYFNDELEELFKGKSIEWNKSILSSFIEDTGRTRKAKTKSEKVYKLIKAVSKEIVAKATIALGTEWLYEF